MTEPKTSKLKVTVETFFKVSYSDLNSFIKEIYGHNFSFVASMECGNDSKHTFYVDGVVDKWDEDTISKFTETGKYGYGSAGYLLNDLCRKGLVEPGKYLVSVSW